MDLLTPLLVIIGFGAVLYFLHKQPAESDHREEANTLREQLALLKANLEQKSEEVGKLEMQLQEERSQRDQQEGKGKALYAQSKQMEASMESLSRENQELRGRLTRLEADRDRRDKEFSELVAKLNAADESLKQERLRVIREDEAKREQEREAWDRMWKEHEDAVIAQLSELCKQPQLGFTTYDNTNLPDGFDGSLKPDFMIEFLGQYVIFDAKESQAKNLQAYINDQFKKTVAKVKKNPKIYPTIYLVIPSQVMRDLRTYQYSLEGYTLYVISPEAIPPILASFKKISSYEFAEQLDPQQRENIVNLIAELDFHINLRNAADLFLSKLGTNILDLTHQMAPDLAEEVELRKRELRSPINLAEIKKLIMSTSLQNAEIDAMVSPKAQVKEKYVEAVKTEVLQQLL